MNPRGYSSRFADSSPPLHTNRDAERAEIQRQTEVYLAGGGKIRSVSARAEPQYRAPVFSDRPGVTEASRRRGGKRGGSMTGRKGGKAAAE